MYVERVTGTGRFLTKCDSSVAMYSNANMLILAGVMFTVVTIFHFSMLIFANSQLIKVELLMLLQVKSWSITNFDIIMATDEKFITKDITSVVIIHLLDIVNVWNKFNVNPFNSCLNI